MTAYKSFRSYKKFLAALNKLVEFYDENEYENNSMTLYNHIRNCSCGMCHPGYEKEIAAFIDFENRTISVLGEPHYLSAEDRRKYELFMQDLQAKIKIRQL